LISPSSAPVPSAILPETLLVMAAFMIANAKIGDIIVGTLGLHERKAG
jgi:hypothetical protein